MNMTKSCFDEEEYEQMDQNEIHDLVADEGEQSDPTIENNNEFEADAEEMEAEAEEEHPDDESQEEANEVEEPTRTRPTRLGVVPVLLNTTINFAFISIAHFTAELANDSPGDNDPYLLMTVLRID